MRLTAYTDYSLRTLIYLAMNRDHLVTIQDIADAHGIAKNHLTKVVHRMGMLGYIDTVRGRNGGLRLGREPADIIIGAVVRQTETDFHMAACFDPASAAGCIYSPACALKGVLAAASAAFLAELDAVTLEQMLVKPGRKGAGKAAVVQFRAPRAK
jgi:Rrf2 family nitric oxide-sensitive transcriptional repressor